MVGGELGASPVRWAYRLYRWSLLWITLPGTSVGQSRSYAWGQAQACNNRSVCVCKQLCVLALQWPGPSPCCAPYLGPICTWPDATKVGQSVLCCLLCCV